MRLLFSITVCVLLFGCAAYAKNCKVAECVKTIGGNCTESATKEFACDVTLNTLEDEGHCQCIQYNVTALGVPCTVNGTHNVCNAGQTCTTDPFNATSPTHCYATGLIGDTCSNDWGCLPPRKCVGGKCVSKLALNAECAGSVAGECPLGSACLTQEATMTTNCTAKPGLDELCSNTNACWPDALSCVKASAAAANGTCKPWGTLENGVYAEYAAQCKSGYKLTNNTCATEAFPSINFAGKLFFPCTDDASCGSTDQPASCECVGTSTSICVPTEKLEQWIPVTDRIPTEKWARTCEAPLSAMALALGSTSCIAKVLKEQSWDVETNYCKWLLNAEDYHKISAFSTCENPGLTADLVACKAKITGSAVAVTLTSKNAPGNSSDPAWQQGVQYTLAIVFGVPPARIQVTDVKLDNTGSGTITINVKPYLGESPATILAKVKAQAEDPNSPLRKYNAYITGATVVPDKSSSASSVVATPVVTFVAVAAFIAGNF